MELETVCRNLRSMQVHRGLAIYHDTQSLMQRVAGCERDRVYVTRS